jgi:hypothetical protein
MKEKMKALCSLCKQPTYCGEFGKGTAGEVIKEIVPRDRWGNNYNLLITHKRCAEAYDEAQGQIHRPTISRERGDITDEPEEDYEGC